MSAPVPSAAQRSPRAPEARRASRRWGPGRRSAVWVCRGRRGCLRATRRGKSPRRHPEKQGSRAFEQPLKRTALIIPDQAGGGPASTRFVSDSPGFSQRGIIAGRSTQENDVFSMQRCLVNDNAHRASLRTLTHGSTRGSARRCVQTRLLGYSQETWQRLSQKLSHRSLHLSPRGSSPVPSYGQAKRSTRGLIHGIA